MAQEQGQRRPGRWQPWGVLLGGLLLTAATGVLLQRAAASRDGARFEKDIQSTSDVILGRMQAYEALLRGAAGLFAASEDVTRAEFHAWVSRVQLEAQYPGVQGLGYAERVGERELPLLMEEARTEGVVFRPRPETRRELYLPIVYLEPLDALNRVALGYDMYTEPTRREAMRRAWVSGLPALSGHVTLVQEEAAAVPQPGFLLYVALYAGAGVPETEAERERLLTGFVYSPFRARDFFGGIFPGANGRRVAFRIFDGPVAGPERELFESDGWDEAEGRLSATTHMSYGGRTWTLTWRPHARDDISPAWIIPGIVSLGLLTSAVSFFLVRAQVQARSIAEHEASARQRSEAQLRLVIDALPAMVLYVDRDFRVRFQNRAFTEYLAGRDDPGLYVRLAGFSTVEEALAAVRPVFEGRTVRFESRLGEGAEARDVSTECVPDLDPDGQVRGYVSLVMDMTEVKRSERALREAVQLRDDFLQVASHELKTPLTPLQLKLQLLLREVSGRESSESSARERRHLEMALRQVGKVTDLVNDLLDVSRIDSGRLRMQLGPVDLAQLVRDVSARLEGQAQQAGVQLKVDTGPCVGNWDGRRLEQVVVNLVDNALKYGAGKPVRVRVRSVHGTAVLEVQDNGIGIAPENLPRIFGRFERAVSERSFGGLGLGLYIVQGIVWAMGGEVSVASRPGEGATFTVRLPLQPSVDVSVGAAPGSSAEKPTGAPGRL